ncbi:MAG: hypothetical protein DRG50_03240 [Deltaproteobacteria bacterium]|nr:MAG: hypothetical protein DRG50_03240 [Deltaproteobacteria bacterium]
MRVKTLFVLLIVFVIILTAGVPWAGGYQFRYKFSPATTYSLRSKDHIVTEGNMGIASQMEMTEVTLCKYRFGAPDKHGNIPFKAALVKSDEKLLVDGKKFPPSAGGSGEQQRWRAKGVITNKGKVISLYLQGHKQKDETFRRSKEKEVFPFPEFPARPLKIGDHFENVDRYEMEGMILVTTTRYTLESLQGGEAEFSIRFFQETKRSPSSNVNTTIKSRGKGQAIFDLKKGFFREIKMAIVSEMETKIPQMPSTPSAVPAVMRTRTKVKSIQKMDVD